MGHRARVEVAGGFHHVTARGNRRSILFHDERDYWSSYRATAGLDPCPPYLRVDTVRNIFGSAQDFADFCNQVAKQPGCK